MKDLILIYVLLVIVIASATTLGGRFGMSVQLLTDQKIAVEKGYAEYNSGSGKFQWKTK